MKHTRRSLISLFGSMRLLSVVLLLQICINNAGAQPWCTTWIGAGPAGFSDAGVPGASTAVNSAGVPYVVYIDSTEDNEPTVQKFTGGSWVIVGTKGFGTVEIRNPKIAISAADTAYVVYTRTANDKPRVWKFDGADWDLMTTTGLSDGAIAYNCIAINSVGTPYVAYRDEENSGKVTVKRFNGSSWSTVGTMGFSSSAIHGLDLFIDASDSLWVACRQSTSIITMKYRGSAWVQIGGNVATAASQIPAIAVYNNVPYVFSCVSAKGVVKKYEAGSWQTIGGGNVSANNIKAGDIAISAIGEPYVAYINNNASGKITVKGIGAGVWVPIGTDGFSAGAVGALSLELDGNDWPIVAYKDITNSNKMTVQQIAFTAVEGVNGICLGNTATLSSNAPGGTWSSGAPGIATIGSSSGLVTGVSSGEAIISYTKNGCTVVWPLFTHFAPIVTGNLRACIGTEAESLNIEGYSGAWTTSSSKISLSPVSYSQTNITGISTGTARITFTATDASIACTATRIVTVTAAVPAITGIAPLCVGGSSLTLGNVTPGGKWFSYDPSANVDSITGVVAPGGTSTVFDVYYQTVPGHASCRTWGYIYVNEAPGSMSVYSSPLCARTYGDAIITNTTDEGQIWSTSNAAIATVTEEWPGHASLHGLSAGTAIVSYRNGAGNACVATQTLSVLASPVITGPASMSPYSTVTLTATPSGGTWSFWGGCAGINSTTGVVTSYGGPCEAIFFNTLPNGCYTEKRINVRAAKPGENPSMTETTSDKLSIYPNPNNGTFTLSAVLPGTGNGAATVTVTDLLGRTVYTDELRAVDDRINKELKITNTPCAGMYLLTLSSGNEKKVIRFTIE